MLVILLVLMILLVLVILLLIFMAGQKAGLIGSMIKIKSRKSFAAYFLIAVSIPAR